MPFLPIQAINRSQAVRIGGKRILPNVTSYIDVTGNILPVLAPTLTNNEVGKKAAGKGLKKSVWFAYGVSAVDAEGKETPLTNVGALKTGAVAEAESELDFGIVKFVQVEHAVKYNIFRTGVGKTGFSTEALALAGTFKLIGTVAQTGAVEGKFEDTNSATSEEGTTEASYGPNTTFFNTSKTAWSTKHELQNHFTEGTIVIVGAQTPNPGDWAPLGKNLEVTLGSEKVELAEAKEYLRRSTGEVRKVAASGSMTAKKTATAGKQRLSVVVYNWLLNQFETIEGEEETEETFYPLTSIVPAEAKLKKYQQKILLVRTTNSVVTPEILDSRVRLLRVTS